MENNLRVWHNGYEWIAATTAEGALAFYCELTGIEPDDTDDFTEFTNLSLKFIYEDEEKPEDREETLAQCLERGAKENGGKPFYMGGTEP